MSSIVYAMISNSQLTLASSIVLVFTSILILFFVSKGKKKNLPPGPFAWPIFGNLLSLDSRPYRQMTELAKKYGPLMSLRLGSQYAVVVSSPEMAKEVLQVNDRFCASRPKMIATHILSEGELDIVAAPYGPYWRKLRKLTHIHLLSRSNLDLSISERIDIVNSMADFLAREASSSGGVVEVRGFLYQATMNIIMSMIIGNRYSFASRGEPPKEAEKLLELVREVFKIYSEANIADFIPFLSLFDPQGVERRAKATKKKVKACFEKMVAKRIEERKNKNLDTVNESGGNFLDTLLDLEEGEITSQSIHLLLEDMFITGTDTSALAVEWALAELISHPSKMERLKNDLEGVNISSRTDFSKFPYLQAVITETFRHRILGILVPHETTEEIKINEYVIPQKTVLYVNAWGIFHDPEVWPEPMTFLPERFLNQNVDIRGSDFRLFPFGSGRRICPGMNLAHSTVEIMLAILIKRFDWHLPEGVFEIDMDEKFSISMFMAKPLCARVTERREGARE